MGKRTRRDIANKVLREAQRAINKQDDRDSQLSQLVYNTLQDWHGTQGPLRETWVLVSLAAGLAAPGVLQAMELPVDAESVAEIEALMVVKWMRVLTSVTQDDITAFRADQRGMPV